MLRDYDVDLRGNPDLDDARTAVIALLYVGSRLVAPKDLVTSSKDLIQGSARSQVLTRGFGASILLKVIRRRRK
jgi:hypothetical protein